MSKSLIYLASPYMHERSAIRELRFYKVCRAVAFLLKEDTSIMIFSPIAHSHNICMHGLKSGFDFWKEFDFRMLNGCDELWVLTLDGYKESIGVSAEIRYAVNLGKPVSYVDYRKEWE